MLILYRVVGGLLGLLFLGSGVEWIRDPESAAEGLGVLLPEGGLGRSTLIGDLGAFFLGTGTFALLGTVTGRARWYRAAALMLALAALMRTQAAVFHGASWTELIAVEVVLTAVLVGISSRFD